MSNTERRYPVTIDFDACDLESNLGIMVQIVTPDGGSYMEKFDIDKGERKNFRIQTDIKVGRSTMADISFFLYPVSYRTSYTHSCVRSHTKFVKINHIDINGTVIDVQNVLYDQNNEVFEYLSDASEEDAEIMAKQAFGRNGGYFGWYGTIRYIVRLCFDHDEFLRTQKTVGSAYYAKKIPTCYIDTDKRNIWDSKQ